MQINVILTNDSDMGEIVPGTGQLLDKKDIVDYLEKDPRNAVQLVGVEEEGAVFRGAGETLDNFYFQTLPMEDPGDADGGDLTAAQALDLALEFLGID